MYTFLIQIYKTGVVVDSIDIVVTFHHSVN